MKLESDEKMPDHTKKFFDIVDKLAEMDLAIPEDLKSMLLLYSLPHR